jgi:hypothetical protein
MKIELNCQHCNKNFETEYKFRDKKFCSRNCYFENARQGKIKIGRSKDETIREERECKICGTKFESKKNHSKELCSDECRVKWGQKPEIIEKRLESTKKTIQEKYGVDHVWQVKEIHEKTIQNRDLDDIGSKISLKLKSKTEEEKNNTLNKRKNTKEKIHGNPFYNNSIQISDSLKTSYKNNGEEIKNKREKTMTSKYGVKSSLQLEVAREKLEEIRDEVTKKGLEVRKINYLNYLNNKLQENNLSLISEYEKNKENTKSLEYTFQCLKCENIFTSTVLGSGKIPICRKCNPTFSETHISNKIKEILENNDINYISNDRKLIYPYELDFYLPDFNIAFEVNGNYYHSELGGQKDRIYHINKTKLANNKNVKVIQIYEDEIIQKLEIVQSKILHFLGKQKNRIYARKCEIKILDNKSSGHFLEQNHLQGNSKASIKIGLYHENELVSVMTFSKGRIVTNNSGWELVRFCNKKETSVIGSFNKLLKHFVKNYDFDFLITYCDIRWSGINPKDTVYFKNNLQFVGFTPPSYWYMDKKNYNNRHHRFNFRKAKLVSEGYDNIKTEWEIMQERGFDRIWDCGTMKFIYKK